MISSVKATKSFISQLSSSACPVVLLKSYLAMSEMPPDSKDFIFKPISKGKGSYKLVTPDKLLLEGLFAETCKVSELNRPSLVCIPYDLEEPLWKRIME